MMRVHHLVCIILTDSDASAQREMKILFPDFDPVQWYRSEEWDIRNEHDRYFKMQQQHKLYSRQGNF